MQNNINQIVTPESSDRTDPFAAPTSEFGSAPSASSAPPASPRCNPTSDPCPTKLQRIRVGPRPSDFGPRPSSRSGARIALLAAMALGGMFRIAAFGSEIPRSDGKVTARVGEWRTQDAKLDEPERVDWMLPDGLEYSGESPRRIITLRKTFEAPKDFEFRPLDKKNQSRIDLAREGRNHFEFGDWRHWEQDLQYVDVWADLESTLLWQVKSSIRAREGVGEHKPSSSRIRVYAVVAELQWAVEAYPLRCEGNLARITSGTGGVGGSPNEWFWAARVADFRISIDVDANNDGHINEYDEKVRGQMPGHIIWVDKEKLWIENELDSTVGRAEIVFETPERKVPTGHLATLAWGKQIKLFLDAECANELTPVTPAHYFRIYAAGEVVPERVFYRANEDKLGEDYVLDSQLSAHAVELTLKVTRDGIRAQSMARVYVANTPATTAKNKTIILWDEDLSWAKTGGNQWSPAKSRYPQLKALLEGDVKNSGQHVNRLLVNHYQASGDGGFTVEQFNEMKDAGWVFSYCHGLPGGGRSAFATFKYDVEGEAAADAFVVAINGPNGSYAMKDKGVGPGGQQLWWDVIIEHRYFVDKGWGAVRDQNNAVWIPAMCHSAEASATNPSFVDAVGGAFVVGRVGIESWSSTKPENVVLNLRTLIRPGSAGLFTTWRSVLGSWVNADTTYRGDLIKGDWVVKGHGKVTLWPALLRHDRAIESWAAFPTKDYWTETGAIYILFDTRVVKEDNVLRKLSGDASGGAPAWWEPLGSSQHGHAIKVSYTDQKEENSTRMQIRAGRVLTPFTFIEFSGDGASCTMNYEWEF